ncbi:RNA polymerase sigma factor [Deminuibacter soli]|uniref:RNA polymerase sigma-70 factor n=1 Tax=Deminuibacter soli TaxID=2291815 RepID=A0A3E1NPW4_9BACT|nr:sigma-70 family RNA polymerase sigma factor [Deminuibacter soli]RFM29975.1 hypothetical protein DXN05_03095 [Deminuibacter soli]
MQSGKQSLSDEQLIEYLKNDREDVFWMLYNRYLPILLFEAFQLLGRRDEAQDVVQEVLVRFWRSKHYLNVDSSLKLFLFRSVRNESINMLRSRKRQTEMLQKYRGTVCEWESVNPSENIEIGRAIQRAHKMLPPQQAMAFRLNILERRKKTDIAAAMGISINSVKTHLRLAVTSMKKRLVPLR